jgi:hypothetical protein
VFVHRGRTAIESSAGPVTHGLPGRFSWRGVRRLASLVVLVTAAVLAVVVPPLNAMADPAAAAVIGRWSDQLVGNTFKPVVLTAIQGGGPSVGAPGAAYVSAALTRGPDGSLATGRVPVLFSDRQAVITGRPPGAAVRRRAGGRVRVRADTVRDAR